MSRKGRSSSRTVSSAAQPSAQRSEAQLAANRANAQKSTGPRTAEGKARSSQNALKHGLFSKAMLQSFKGPRSAGERSDYDAMLADMHAAFRPSTPGQCQMVDRMAARWWRLSRICAEREAFRLDSLASSIHWSTADVARMSAPFAVEEDRIDRAMSRSYRDLEFLQRWEARTDVSYDLEPLPAQPEPVEPHLETPPAPVEPEPEAIAEPAEEPESPKASLPISFLVSPEPWDAHLKAVSTDLGLEEEPDESES